MTPAEKMAIKPQDMPSQAPEERRHNMREVALGYTEEMARELIFENSLNIAGVQYDASVKTAEDSLAAVVYSQSPAAAGGTFPRGTKVSVYLTVDPAKIAALQDAAPLQ